MPFSYTGKRAYDFDLGAVSFQVSDGERTEAWKVSELALTDKFGATGITPEELFAAFDPNADYITSVGDNVQSSRPSPLMLQSSDF